MKFNFQRITDFQRGFAFLAGILSIGIMFQNFTKGLFIFSLAFAMWSIPYIFYGRSKKQ